MPRLLAFDTSTEILALALLDGDRAWSRAEAGGANASARLVPAIEALLAEAGLVYRDLDAIAFGRGPGAFTGLRTSCAVAQGLAFGAGKPVLPVDSLMIVAEDARAQRRGMQPLEVAVAMDARMDEVYAARYRFDGAGWQAASAPALYALDDLVATWQGTVPDLLAGSALRAFGDRLRLPEGERVDAEADRAAALLRLAAQQWHQGAAQPAEQALPLYLRDKVALTTAEREARKVAS